MTKEHIFRDKWAAYFGGEKIEYWRWGTRANAMDRVEPFFDQYRADAFSQTIGGFCQRCNGGWMNDLENAVEPFLPAILRGGSIPLSVEQTKLLFRWMCKTAYVIAAGDVQPPGVSHAMKRRLMDGGVPEQTHGWALPLLKPRSNVQTRTTVATLPPRDTYRITSFYFRSGAFLVTHGFTRLAADIVGFEHIFGTSMERRRRSWECLPTIDHAHPESWPDYHAYALERLDEDMVRAGVRRVFAPANDAEPPNR